MTYCEHPPKNPKNIHRLCAEGLINAYCCSDSVIRRLFPGGLIKTKACHVLVSHRQFSTLVNNKDIFYSILYNFKACRHLIDTVDGQ